MRKGLVLSTTLSLLLAFSGIQVSAAESAKEDVFEGKESGVVINIPEEYQSLKGTIEFDDLGDNFTAGKGQVEIAVIYYPYDKEELQRRTEEEGEAEDNGELEKAWKLLEEMQDQPVFHIVGLNDGRGVDDLIELYLSSLEPDTEEESDSELTEEEMEAEKKLIHSKQYIELGTCDGFTYILVAPSPENIDREKTFIGYDDSYYDEYISLVENVDKMVDRIQLVGGVELTDPVELAEKGTGIHFETTDLDGNPVDSSDLFAGHPITMINLWATWCGPCIAELPELEKLNGEFLKDNCQIIGIVTDANKEEKISRAKELLTNKGVTYLNLASFEGLSELLPQNSWPTSYFVDEKGCLVGEPVTGAKLEQYPKRLEELLELSASH